MSNHGHNTAASEAGGKKVEGRPLGLLRIIALIAVVVGAVGSVGLMLRAGQSSPLVLKALFSIWVLSPFAALVWTYIVSKRWSILTRVTLYFVMLAVALASLAIYSGLVDIKPAGSANAFLYVAVPPACWVFIAIVVGGAAFIRGRLSRRSVDS
jgi:hypothetical protein